MMNIKKLSNIKKIFNLFLLRPFNINIPIVCFLLLIDIVIKNIYPNNEIIVRKIRVIEKRTDSEDKES